MSDRPAPLAPPPEWLPAYRTDEALRSEERMRALAEGVRGFGLAVHALFPTVAEAGESLLAFGALLRASRSASTHSSD